ncbi:nose resistant to fluoxetine protein 6-like isoform X2 [Vespa mandarinia]|uniref:nose resistant to fluoxetine protein 6-like isoform X2 n=1 Tax=Vespa mandarinia TaxID=7446 RepID=UPI00161CB512|nr:nose resistant to fluoxetine protein 6-like isoform X2 [Vespa mandarinia]
MKMSTMIHRHLSRFFFLLSLIRFSNAGKPVDILSTSGFSVFKEDEILRMFSPNKTDPSDNFTIIDFIGILENHTADGLDKVVWKLINSETIFTNPYYDTFTEEIDLEASRLLKIVPAYDPGAGSVSTECKRDAEKFHRELNKFTLWALKMYDATAKIPSGLLNGNVNQLGDFDECIETVGNDGIQGQYCLAYLQLDIDESRPDLKHLHRLLHSHYIIRSNVTDPGHRVPRFSTVNWAVCTPASCSFRDVEISLRDTLSKYTSQSGLKISVRVDRDMCQMKNNQPLPRETIFVSIFFVSVAVLTLIAAYYDHRKLSTSEILLSFSLKRNFQKLISLERIEGDITILHGVRAFNALMLLLAHKSMALFYNPYTNRTGMSEYLGEPWTVVGRAASLYTDPFIMLSGLLTAYSFLGRIKKTGHLDIKNEYLSRFLRLVPTLGALILFCTYILPYLGSGPQWNLVIIQHANICKQTWWRNFLFIHNYFGFENMCLTHTHHVGIDTQLFALSPLLVLLLYKKPKIGSIVLFTLATFSTILRYYVTYFKRLNNYVYFGISIKQLFDTANMSYILPTHRLTVYIIGIFVGYLLRSLPKEYKMKKTTYYIGWILCTVMFFGSIFGPAKMGTIDYIYNPMHAAAYNAFAPIGWCALFAWIIVIHQTGNTNGCLSRILAWRGFLITTRLGYAIYLTQFPVFFYNVGQTRSAEYYDFLKLVFNIVEMVWILIASVILTLLFDTPFQNIKNHLLKKQTLREQISKPLKLE